MKFSKEYSKLQFPIFTTIRQDKGYYKVGDLVYVHTPKQEFTAEIVSLRPMMGNEITETIALRDADCSVTQFNELMVSFYKKPVEKLELILITLMKKEK